MEAAAASSFPLPPVSSSTTPPPLTPPNDLATPPKHLPSHTVLTPSRSCLTPSKPGRWSLPPPTATTPSKVRFPQASATATATLPDSPARPSYKAYPVQQSLKGTHYEFTKTLAPLLPQNTVALPPPPDTRFCACVDGCSTDCFCALNGVGCWWDFPGHGCACCAKTSGPSKCKNPSCAENYRYDSKKINKRRREVMEALRKASEPRAEKRTRRATSKVESCSSEAQVKTPTKGKK